MGGQSDKTKPLKFICEPVPKSFFVVCVLKFCISAPVLSAKNFFEKIWQFEQNEVFVKFWKSKFLWHSHSTDRESERLICDIMAQLFRNWKTGFYAYP